MNDLSLRIKELRKNRGWTQAKLAEKVKRSASAVSSYEQDVQQPPLDVIISIADALGVTVDGLLGTGDTVTVKGLSKEKKELLELLVQEFQNPSHTGADLSLQQLEILRRLIAIFVGAA